MRKLFVAMALLLAVVASGEELTADKIIAAHEFGAPPEKIVEKVNDPANTVAPLLAANLEKMRAAGVPEAVITAMQAKAQPAPQPLKPDHPEMEKVVKLVQSGVTETLIIDLIKQTPNSPQLTHGDLIYLKENRVPDAVIAALMQASSVNVTPAAAVAAAPGSAAVAAGAAVPTPKPSLDTTIDGLLLMRGDRKSVV